MTPLKPPRKPRPYQKHGLVALQNALKGVADRESWLENLGEVGEALKAWKADLMTDLGGEEAVSTQERAVVELAVKTYLLLESVDRWLLQQPSLVNKSRRQLFPVVLQRQQLADALARYMTQLGLKRKARRVPSLQEYVAANYGGDGSGEDTEPEQSGNSVSPSSRASRSPAAGFSRPPEEHGLGRGGDVSEKAPSGRASGEELEDATGGVDP